MYFGNAVDFHYIVHTGMVELELINCVILLPKCINKYTCISVLKVNNFE